jgi:hypothetical protein
VFAEIVKLVGEVIWPVTLVLLLLVFRSRVDAILVEIPALLRRLVSGKAMGLELQFQEFESKLNIAELEALNLALRPPLRPGAAEEKENQG